MSIQFKIPHQARFRQTANIFTGTFNIPTPGVYDFSIPANAGAIVFPLQPNSTYLIERVTFGGDISGIDYAAALDLAAGPNIPTVSLRRLLDNSSIYESALPFPSYVSQQECSVFVSSDREGDAVIATVTGRLLQTIALVGIPAIRLSLVFSVYAAESTIFNMAFRAGQKVGR